MKTSDKVYLGVLGFLLLMIVIYFIRIDIPIISPIYFWSLTGGFISFYIGHLIWFLAKNKRNQRQ